MHRNELPFSPAAERNRAPIAEVLRARLTSNNAVLEIGSGTGQHAIAFHDLVDGLRWQPSERPDRLAPLDARLALEGRGRLPGPLPLDVRYGPWPDGPFDAVFTANTLHIMGWDAVRSLLTAVPDLLVEGGQLLIYGPFKRGGTHTAPSNAAFDRQLRETHPRQGIRDLEALESLAARHQLLLDEVAPMPANNLLLCFCKITENQAHELTESS